MIYPGNYEQKIGFDTVRSLIAEECSSPLGVRLVGSISFTSDFEEVRRQLTITDEFRQVLLFERGLPSLHFYDLTGELEHLRIEGLYLDVEPMFNLKASINTLHEYVSFFRKASIKKYTHLCEIAGQVEYDTGIADRLEAIIDDKGRIRESASKRLSEIRHDLIIRRIDADKKVEQILKSVKKSGWADEGIEATVRNGRMVIPMPATHKRKIKGLVHDESSTGQTVFIEPEEVFDMNNEIRELELEERREIVRILVEFADYLRPRLDGLLEAYHFLGLVDFIRAKASFAIKVAAVMPVLSDKPLLYWEKAVHPLLYLSHQRQRKKVVPLNIRLDETQRILIISGPNAGGKSVCLKTIGLLQYMLQCGLLAPMSESSEAGIFDDIFIDIGDQQSLENDLSTYSSHLLNMQYFLAHTGKKTLFLIDEFGSGTEPQLGGAIAEAVLGALNEKEAFGVITTHYANLKLLAGKQAGIINGAMLFDQVNLEPLFLLEMGRPGSSFAFEIASKIGLDIGILNKAADITGRGHLDFDQQLQQLDTERKAIEVKSTQFRVADDFLAEMIEKYEKMTKDFEAKRKEILENARAEAKRIVDESNKIIEKTIREIRENQAEKEATKVLRTQMKEELSKGLGDMETRRPGDLLISPRPPVSQSPSPPVPKSPSPPVSQSPSPQVPQSPSPPVPKSLAPGAHVKLSGQTGIGIIEEIKGKEALVAFGSMRMRCLLEKLFLVSEAEIKAASQSRPYSTYNSYVEELNANLANYQLTLDLRGQRAEDALSTLRRYIDEAILYGMNEVRILHGKGDGILRSIVRDYLITLPEVKEARDEAIERGGHGITVVKFSY